MKKIFIVFVFLLTACSSEQINSLEAERPLEQVKEKIETENLENMQFVEVSDLRKSYLEHFQVDEERVISPLFVDINNDGNLETIYYNEVYPTDLDNIENIIAIYDENDALLTTYETEMITYIDLIKNKTFGNVLILHSVTPSGSTYSIVIAFTNNGFIKIGELEAHRSLYEYKENDGYHEIMTKHYDFNSQKAMADPTAYYDVTYIWNAEIRKYELVVY